MREADAPRFLSSVVTFTGGYEQRASLVVNPVVLGAGRTLFDGIEETLSLKLTKTRAFGNGSVLLCYEPMA